MNMINPFRLVHFEAGRAMTAQEDRHRTGLRAALAIAGAAFVVSILFSSFIWVGGVGGGFFLIYFLWSVRAAFGTQPDFDRTEDRLFMRRARYRRRRAARLSA